MVNTLRLDTIIRETDGHVDPRILARTFQEGGAALGDQIAEAVTKAIAAHAELGILLQALLSQSAENPATQAASSEGVASKPRKSGEITRLIFAAAERLDGQAAKTFSIQQISAEARLVAAPAEIRDQQVRSAVKSLCTQKRLERLRHNQYRVRARPSADASRVELQSDAVH